LHGNLLGVKYKQILVYIMPNVNELGVENRSFGRKQPIAPAFEPATSKKGRAIRAALNLESKVLFWRDLAGRSAAQATAPRKRV
jgi:hypothetical protein